MAPGRRSTAIHKLVSPCPRPGRSGYNAFPHDPRAHNVRAHRGRRLRSRVTLRVGGWREGAVAAAAAGTCGWGAGSAPLRAGAKRLQGGWGQAPAVGAPRAIPGGGGGGGRPFQVPWHSGAHNQRHGASAPSDDGCPPERSCITALSACTPPLCRCGATRGRACAKRGLRAGTKARCARQSDLRASTSCDRASPLPRRPGAPAKQLCGVGTADPRARHPQRLRRS